MKLQWLGHLAFTLTESTGASVLTEPFDESETGYPMPAITCDAVTYANKANKRKLKALNIKSVIIDDTSSHEINGIDVQGFYSDNDKNEENLIFKFRLDGVSVCHLGAIKEECNAEIVEELMPVNVLLIPIGGNEFSIDAEQAKDYVDNIMPDIVIPMMFKTKNTDLDIDKVDDFLRLFDDEQIIIADKSTIEFDRFDFKGESTIVIVPKRH